MDMLSFAIVGAGGHAAAHIKNIEKFGPEYGCRVSAVAIRPQDRQPGQVEEFEAKGVRVFADAVEMFDATAGQVDAVFIPTGIHTHAPLVCAAAARGHNIYLEKPPAGTVQEIDQMLAAVRQGGRLCWLGFQSISSESIQMIKRRVVDGSLGAVRELRTWAFWWRPDKYYTRNEWAGQARVGEHWVLDGPSNNALAHETANMLYLASPRPRAFAEPAAVRAELYHARDITGEDTSGIEIELAGGGKAWFLASHCTEGDHVGPWIEAVYERGRVHWHFDGQTEVAYADGRRETLAKDSQSPMLAALQRFCAAIRSGKADDVDCDLAMGRNFTLAINGAFESAGQTRQIPAEYIRRGGEGPDATTLVPGLREAIARGAAEGRLYSELGLPWARPTARFSLAGYRSFPQRFGLGR